MKILFITATNLGDTVLSMGALDELIRRYPHARFTIACGPAVTELFKSIPQVEKIIPMVKGPFVSHWRHLARQTLRHKWDVVVDLRNSILSRLYICKKIHVWNKQQDTLHKVEQIAQVIGAAPAPAPRLWYSASDHTDAKNIIPERQKTLIIGPTAKWPGKIWPAENYAALAKALTAKDSALFGAKIAVIAATGEEKQGYALYDQLDADIRIDLIAKCPLSVVSAILSRATLYIGNDSGLTHLAAASGCKTLALFGPGWPQLYRPWGPHAAFVATPENAEELLAPYKADLNAVTSSLMRSLTVDAAKIAAEKLLTA
jgi:heptosyltransferase-3